MKKVVKKVQCTPRKSYHSIPRYAIPISHIEGKDIVRSWQFGHPIPPSLEDIDGPTSKRSKHGTSVSRNTQYGKRLLKYFISTLSNSE